MKAKLLDSSIASCRPALANRSVQSTLFISLGSDENEKMKAAFQQMTTALRDHAPATLRWRSQFTPRANHGNNAELATPVALRWAFDPQWEPAVIMLDSAP